MKVLQNEQTNLMEKMVILVFKVKRFDSGSCSVAFVLGTSLSLMFVMRCCCRGNAGGSLEGM
jgi:hypothetical protein